MTRCMAKASKYIKKPVIIWILLMSLSGISLQHVNATGYHSPPSNRWVLWSGSPATSWEHSFVTGNGRHGMMITGNIDDNRIICTHEELFIRGWDHHKVTVPTTAYLMPKVRELMEVGQTDAAAKLLTEEANRQLNEMGAPYRWPLIPHPAFDLRIQMKERLPGGTAYYRRQLNLETGEAFVYWNGSEDDRFEESAFSSRKDNVNVIRLKANGKNKLSLALSLEETPGRKGSHFDHDLDNAFLPVKNEATSGWLTYRARYAKDPGGYEGLARVTLEGGRMQQKGNCLEIENADEVLVILRVTPLEDGNSATTGDVKKELSRLSRNYADLLAPHSREHGDMFRRMQFDLGCAKEWETTPTEKMLATAKEQGATPLFLEQVQAMGRYLLISSSGKYPPPLQGIWGGGWKPDWIGGFVWDSNINLAISAASMSNLPECAETYCTYVESLLPGWRLNAKNYLGCRGFIVAHYNDPENGYLTHFASSFPWMFWAGGAGWNIRPFDEHAMLTGDKQFLRDRVLPLYREIAEFYEDFLVMGNDGLYHICPSISPENAPPGTNTWLSKDATMDVAIAREVFGLLCRMGHEFNLDKDEIKKWSSYLNRLPVYRINEDGALAEWVDKNYPDVYQHRHNSHLYPVFPGTEFRCADKKDTALMRAARVALEKRYAFDTSSAHGLIHLALQAARMENAGRVEQNLDRFSRRRYLYNGLVSSHEPNNEIYNLDAILSFPRLLMEMLVFTETGRIELLPAWPSGYPDGNIKGMRVYGGHTIDLSWESGKLKSLAIHAGSNERSKLVYGNEEKDIELVKGEIYDLP